MISGTVETALMGLNAALESMQRTAARIAEFTSETDLIKDIVQLSIDERRFEANIAVIRTADDMIGSLLDILA